MPCARSAMARSGSLRPERQRKRDSRRGALVAVAAPPGGKFRILEKQRIKGKDFEGRPPRSGTWPRNHCHADRHRHHRAGKAVHQLVSKWFPAEAYHYSVHLKAQMVLKAKNVISAGRLSRCRVDGCPSGLHGDQAGIHQQGRDIHRRRAGGIGHADVAWAVMHAIYFEPLDSTQSPGGSSTMEIF
jgi:hypothetical protein